MANKIQVKRSAVASKVPTTTDLDLGEIAINTYDGKVYIKQDSGTPSVLEVGKVKENRANTFTSNQIIQTTDNTNAALRVTQLGTGLALRIEDETNPDSTPFVVDATGNVGIGTTSPTYQLQIVGSSYESFLGIQTSNLGLQVGVGANGFGSLSTTTANGIILGTDSTERVRIEAGGNVIIRNSLKLGVSADATLARSSAGNLSIDGNIIYRAGGTDVTVSDGGTGLSSATAYAVLCGGTTSTGAFQPLASLGTSGQVLTSNGADALPSWQTAAGGSAVFVATSAPSSPSAGDLWWKSDEGQLKIYYNDGTSSQWVDAATSATSSGGATYPAAGIPNSTGTAWGTSYTTSGSGTVVALTTSPSFTTPILGTPTSGNLSNCTADGTNSLGFLGIPQNTQNAAYTLVLADAGKHLIHTDSTARTWTIPANSSVAYPVGTTISFVNTGSANVTIAITTDTLTLAGTGQTGSRTLSQYGTATALKISSTSWILSGVNLT